GNTFTPRANHQVAFVQTGPNEQQVWFSVDVAFDVTPNPFGPWYNRRYRADANSPWYWQYSQSIPISGGGGFVDQVLYSPTPKYSSTPGATLYKYVMYGISQPTACNGPNGGYVTVSFSNDGYCWTSGVPMWSETGVTIPCASELGGGLVSMEAIGAIDSGTGYVYFMGMEGDNTVLINEYNMSHNFVSWGYTLTNSMGRMVFGPPVRGADPNEKNMSDLGLFNPRAFDDGRGGDRYRSYAYFFNMAMAWDAANGDLYISRGYPYPYDRCNTCNDPKVPTPQQNYESKVWNSYAYTYQSVSGCGGQAALYPNRYQVYKMHLGSLSNFSLVHTGTWTLLADRGNSLGYESAFTFSSTPLVAGQSNEGRDGGAASFMVDGAGTLVRENGSAFVFSGNTLRENLSVGRPCQTTGLERVTLRTIP
ncbi:MAG TPA: hypothetical protein VJ276_09180, partial [Thermoanaerobaculia bacterium]|nr:hypothetical protein [Thermoanaerobaculia bacterium]